MQSGAELPRRRSGIRTCQLHGQGVAVQPNRQVEYETVRPQTAAGGVINQPQHQLCAGVNVWAVYMLHLAPVAVARKSMAHAWSAVRELRKDHRNATADGRTGAKLRSGRHIQLLLLRPRGAPGHHMATVQGDNDPCAVRSQHGQCRHTVKIQRLNAHGKASVAVKPATARCRFARRCWRRTQSAPQFSHRAVGAAETSVQPAPPHRPVRRPAWRPGTSAAWRHGSARR